MRESNKGKMLADELREMQEEINKLKEEDKKTKPKKESIKVTKRENLASTMLEDKLNNLGKTLTDDDIDEIIDLIVASDFLAVANINEKEGLAELDLIHDEIDVFMPFYTSEQEIKGKSTKDTQIYTFNIFQIYDILNSLKGTEKVTGIVINPENKSFIIPLEYLFQIVESLQKN